MVLSLAVPVGGAMLATIGSASTQSRSLSRGQSSEPPPNIVFILTDDLSRDLVRYMPHVLMMQRRGLTFDLYFVSDSRCCPSRASIFTGLLPHNSGVYRNTGSHGGIVAFDHYRDAGRTVAVALQRVGYRTALMGKYLNRYMAPDAGVPATYVPPGWSEWDAAGWGYQEFNYWMNSNGKLRYYGGRPSDYLTDVMAQKAAGFIQTAGRARKPFFLELSTFAPHSPFVPAPRDAHGWGKVRAPRPPNFNVVPTNPPSWLTRRRPFTAAQRAAIDKVFRERAQSVQAVDRMIGTVEAALSAAGVAQNTYIVFSSDNGLHDGERGLMPGKLTPFDSDIRVPLIVVGPGVPAGARTEAMAENIDLAPTFASIGGAALHADGDSLLPILQGQHPAGWRNAILVEHYSEHHGPDGYKADPDAAPPESKDPGTYNAIRGTGFLYVEYADGELEFHNLFRDRFELRNIAGRLTQDRIRRLHAELKAMKRCHGGNACWRAMHVR